MRSRGRGAVVSAMRWRSSATDVLTTVIETLRVRGSVICRSELRGPWGMKLHSPGVAHFHMVERGRCFLRIRGMRRPVLLEAGDLAMVPHDNGHILSDPENPPAQAMIALDELETPGACRYLCNAGCGAETRLICGAFRFEGNEVHPLLSLLPPLVQLPSADGHPPDWLDATIRLLAAETRTPRAGTETIVTRLTDVVFVQLLRAWVERLPTGEGGWLGAMRDPQIGAALGLIHREPQRPWTIAALAAAVGSSRSPFAARFRSLVGEPPLAYVTRWRMQSATTMLSDGGLTVSEIAERVGYDSLPAFSKAFKRRLGSSPSSWRRRGHVS
jgi:AraC-like DNA-binding protein